MPEGSQPLFTNFRTGQQLPVGNFAIYVRNVKDFGAVGNGIADDAPAIQAAINDIPDGGGVVFIPNGTYLIGSKLTLGNDDNGGFSTKRGIEIWGESPPSFRGAPDGPGVGVRLIWSGALNGNMMGTGGPFTGLTLRNLWLEGNSLGGTGLQLISTGMVTLYNINISNFRQIGYQSSCLSGFGNCEKVIGRNIVISCPAVNGAIGALFDGASDGTASSYMQEYTNIRIFPSATQPNIGMLLKVADGCTFQNLLILANAVVGGTFGVVFDYSGHAAFPSQNMFILPDVGFNISSSSQWVNSGSPGAQTKPNLIVGVGELNQAFYPTNVPNLTIDLPTRPATTITESNRTTAIGATTLYTPYYSGIYRLVLYYNITTTGAAGTIDPTVSWNDGTTSRTLALPTLDVTTTDYDQQEIKMRVEAGTNISYAFTFTGVGGTPAYNVFGTLERLS